MSPFWSSLFQYLRHCGRSGTLFIASLLLVLPLVILWAQIEQAGGQKIALEVLAGIFLIWVAVAVRKARLRRHERFRRHPLSADELRVAREKLRRNRDK